MKNKYSYIFLISMAALLITACTEPFGPGPNEEEKIPLNIDGSIRQVQTKATAQGFVDKDAVGLFAVNYSDNNTVAGTLAASGNQADNVKYVYDEPNQKWVPVRPVYYKNIHTHADLYLYYPYQSTITDVNAANFEVQKDQSAAATATSLSGYEASDWMWGKGEDITPSESKVQIQLSHRLSAVQVSLTEGTGFGSGEFASLSKSVILTGTTRKATLNYATGEATPVGSAQLDGIVMCPQNDGSWRAVVIPQTAVSQVQLFAITIGGTTYSYKQDAAVEYQVGKQMNVALTINKKSPSGDYEIMLGGTTITDWREDLNSHGGEARQYFVVNLTTAGTLQSTIEAAQKNPAKIRNLKITGEATADDFYYMRDQMTILEAVNMKEAKIVHIRKTWEGDYYDDIIPNNAFKGKKSLVSFVFPEHITEIGDFAFVDTYLSGALTLPDGVVRIGSEAFARTLIGSVQFPSSLEIIGNAAFYSCKSLTGPLLFPDGLLSIENSAFSGCLGLSGHLILPDSLEELGDAAFSHSGSFTGDLIIPEKITNIKGSTFDRAKFSGNLLLSNVRIVGEWAFEDSGFSGELILPEGLEEIGSYSFYNCGFSSVVLPSTLKVIKGQSFESCTRMSGSLVVPEGVISIGESAFRFCKFSSVSFPSTLQTIQLGAFYGCVDLSSITCSAIEAPTVGREAFDGVAKDNFTVGVPAQSVQRYQAEPGWSDFKRIAANYDFSLSRPRMRALNGAQSRTYTLRAPANFSWSVDDTTLPSWITVSPMSGTGKTDVVISITEMARTDDTFEVNEGTFNNPFYQNYKGRSGVVTFKLDEKESSFTFDVEQYDYDYPDGHVQVLHEATQGPGIDIVFTGEGYDARDIAKGTFAANATTGFEHFFDVEPYKTYKNYFNVYAVTAQSDDSGIGTVNTVKDSKFGTIFSSNRIMCEQPEDAFTWAKKANGSMDLSKSLVILLMNTSTYEGVCIMYGDGSALACCPVSTEAYPYDFRGIIQHEAGGHGFGKLADEYIYHNAYIQNCDCSDGCDHPKSDEDGNYGVYKSLGWYKNLSMSGDASQVPWAHLIYHPQYSDYVDMFEGGYMHSRGIYRSEATSCMNNNIPYYSAISRQAIVERIKAYAGETFTLEDFYAHDDKSFGPITKAVPWKQVDRTFGVDPKFFRATGQGPVFMGDHPNVK